MQEAMLAIGTIRSHPEYLAALERRGIGADKIDNVQIDPWPAGAFDYECEEGRRISRCISFLRENATDNGYARPIEGIVVHFDNGRNEVIEVIDHGVTPLPPNRASYMPEDQPHMRTDLKPIQITQPGGPSFTVDGNCVRWQKWQFRISFDPFEGLVLHQIAYDDDDGRLRPILHRASICEMVVPYGDAGPLHGWKNAFDAGEWGLGRMTQSLKLGCDCLGEIRYFDATLANEQGNPWVIENAICMHEEDYGILWKHVDLWGGTSEVRRSRRLVVSFISTVGNYEYGFFWYFYLDGNIQLEVKLTGIVSPMAIDPGAPAPPYANVIAEGVAAPHHQHMFNARLDFDVDGEENEIYEVDAARMPPGPDNPWQNVFRAVATRLESERGRATRDRFGCVAHMANREPERTQRARPAHGVQARADDVDAHPAGRRRLSGRPAGDVRDAQPLGYALRARRAARRGRVPESAPRGRRPAAVDGRRSFARQHRSRGVVQLRSHALRATRGLARHAGRVHRLHVAAVRILRPQPRTGRATVEPLSRIRLMRLLVTNDDGVEAQGIHVLAAALRDAGNDVLVVAPNSDRSGTGAAIGLIHADQHLDAEAVEMPGCAGIPAYALDGPPGLCVSAARLGAFGTPPEIVVSGINSGCNTGHAILHSGTVGAALTAQSFGGRRSP